MANILVIGKYYFPFKGGIEENTKNVCETLAAEHSVTVLAYAHNKNSSEETINNVRIIRKPVLFNLKGQPICLSLFSGIDLNQYDIIHFHSPNPLASAQLVWRFTFTKTPPLIVTHHMDIHGRKFLRWLSMPFIHSLLRKADRTIVTSKKNLHISKDLPKVQNVSIVPLSIDPDNYKIDDGVRMAGKLWRKEICGEAQVVGFIGRLARYKGIVPLIKAVKQIPDLHAVIAGDGAMREEIRTLISAEGLDARIHLIGSVTHEDKLKVLSCIDIFVFPSTEITEAFGISQLEAMICKTPVVSSDLPTGVTDVAIHEQTALLAKPGSVPSLVAQIERLLDDLALREELRERAYRHIRNHMTNKVVSQKIKDIFTECLSNEKAS